MDDGTLSLDESMAHCLFYFEEAVRSVADGPERAVRQFEGHFVAAWELRQELLIGESLLGWQGVSEALRLSIGRLVSSAMELPEAAFAGNHASELFHPSWAQVREAANAFFAAKEGEMASRAAAEE